MVQKLLVVSVLRKKVKSGHCGLGRTNYGSLWNVRPPIIDPQSKPNPNHYFAQNNLWTQDQLTTWTMTAVRCHYKNKSHHQNKWKAIFQSNVCHHWQTLFESSNQKPHWSVSFNEPYYSMLEKTYMWIEVLLHKNKTSEAIQITFLLF